MSTLQPTRVGLVVTALPVEFEAVRRHVANRKELTHQAGTVYETGEFEAANARWNIVIVQTGPGNVAAALEVERAVQKFSPEIVLMVGIAGGLKDVKLGDVVISSKVYGFEIGKDGAAGFQMRPGLGDPAYPLVQRAQAVARGEAWKKRLPHNSVAPAAYVGPIASGEKVVASTAAHWYGIIRQNLSDALAVEMEGFGVLQSVRANFGTKGIIVRGVSDLIDDKAKVDSEGWQEKAAESAAAFAFQLLADLEVAPTAANSGANNPALGWGLPRRPKRDFCGREGDLSKLENYLAQGEPVAVVGQVGTGRTQLVVEYIARHQSNFSVVVWLDCQTPDTLASACVRLGREMGLVDQGENLPPGEAADRVRHFLERDARSLVVLADAPDLPSVSSVLPRIGGGSAIATSLNPDWSSLCAVLPLSGLPKEVGAGMMAAAAGENITQEALRLSEQLGGLPLAIEQAAAYLRQTKCSIKDYCNLLETRAPDVLSTGEITYPSVLYRIVQNLRAENLDAARLIAHAVFLGSDLIPMAFCKQMAAFTDPYRADMAIAAVNRYSIAEVLPTGLIMHPMLRKTYLALSKPEMRRGFLADVVLFLGMYVMSDQGVQERGLLATHIDSVVSHCRALDVKSVGFANLLQAAGQHCMVIGQLERAVTVLQESLAETKKELSRGESKELTLAQAEHNLGAALYEAHRFDEALPYAESALSVAERLQGPSGPETLRFSRSLGLILLALGEQAKGAAVLLQALERSAAAAGRASTDYALLVVGSAELLPLGMAIPEMISAVAILRKELGDQHEQVGFAEFVLGGMYAKATQQPGISVADRLRFTLQARGHARRALKILAETMGETNPRYLFRKAQIGRWAD